MHLEPSGFAAALAVERGFVVFADCAAIPLRRSKGLTGDFALISIEDRHLGRYYWSPSRWGYPRRRNAQGKAVFLHREVMGCDFGDGKMVDHINRDKLDARRSNLRFVTQAQNMQNQGARNYGDRHEPTSRHRGVSFNSLRRKWVVNHKLNGEQVYAGGFDTEEEAARVARAWRDEHMPYTGDSSPHRGVCWDKARGKWRVASKVGGRDVFIGRFATEEEAVAAAKAWRAEHMPFAVD